jgi:hypothetical protein
MTWNVIVCDTFKDWFLNLSAAAQRDALAMIEVLESIGPQLNRPYADTIKGSKSIKNLKELRIQHAGKPYRVFYAFDPKRQAIILCGGRKDGSIDKQFYRNMIALAEKEFQCHLIELNQTNADK